MYTDKMGSEEYLHPENGNFINAQVADIYYMQVGQYEMADIN